ncbi:MULTISPECIES: DUF3560 domain-containing protein [Frankia]|nr:MULTISPECIES: DUF3560 domain-containing protein [Frankia]
MATITITHTREEGTLVDGSVKGDGTYEILVANGFRWFRSLDCCSIVYSRGRAAKMHIIQPAAQALRAAGHTVIITIDETPPDFAAAERGRTLDAQDRAQRYDGYARSATSRADSREAAADRVLGGIPPGQPMLVDHYSYAADKRRRERAWSNQDRAAEERDKAQYWQARQRAAERWPTSRTNLDAMLRRVQWIEADMRRTRRRLAENEIRRPFGPIRQTLAWWVAARHGDLEQWAGELDYLREQIALKEQAGEKAWGPGDFKVGDLVVYRGEALPVRRVNQKTLTVTRSLANRETTGTIPYDGGITGRRPASPADDDTNEAS